MFVNPYTGELLGEGNGQGVRDFFRTMVEWHRYVAMSGPSRPTGRAITGASNLMFLFIVVSGLFLVVAAHLDVGGDSKHHVVPPRACRARRAISTGTTRSGSGRPCLSRSSSQAAW